MGVGGGAFLRELGAEAVFGAEGDWLAGGAGPEGEGVGEGEGGRQGEGEGEEGGVHCFGWLDGLVLVLVVWGGEGGAFGLE